MRRGDVLEILDGHGRQDSGFDSGLGSQSLSASRSEGKIRFVCSCAISSSFGCPTVNRFSRSHLVSQLVSAGQIINQPAKLSADSESDRCSSCESGGKWWFIWSLDSFGRLIQRVSWSYNHPSGYLGCQSVRGKLPVYSFCSLFSFSSK